MSPSEPRRTSRNRASAIARLAQAREEIARGMLLGVANDGDADAEQALRVRVPARCSGV